jgi:hypothetical protein
MSDSLQSTSKFIKKRGAFFNIRKRNTKEEEDSSDSAPKRGEKEFFLPRNY